MSRPEAPTRAEYATFRPITTRWMDNDVYGHVNNATYYSFFDTAVSGYLLESGAVDPKRGEVIGLVVESGCSYFAPISFPDVITGGVRVDRVGTSSVAYAVGIFRGDDQRAAAAGRFVHVYVDSATRRPKPLPDALRAAVNKLQPKRG